MAYDEGLSTRLFELFDERVEVEARKMFGGLCYMVNGNMCCGIVKDTLMARVGPDAYLESLKKPHVREMDFTGRPLKGMVYVAPEGLESDEELESWVSLCLEFVLTLPPK